MNNTNVETSDDDDDNDDDTLFDRHREDAGDRAWHEQET